MDFRLPSLPYAFDALEPHIDARTMKIHYSKHHAGYTKKLNAAIAGTDFEGKTIEEILASVNDTTAAGVRNNGGGYYNHALFWEILSPNGGGQPRGGLAEAINKAFGSFDDFRGAFSKAAASRFGSGWAWLCVHAGGEVEICSTPNQDNPLMNTSTRGCSGHPILGLDVWEHAYYLKYQNNRGNYIAAFFNAIDWKEVSERYTTSK